MTTFKYKGLSPDGQKVSGVVKAYNEYEAVSMLRETCSVITNIQEVKERLSLNVNLGSTKIKDKDLSIMCSQFAIILSSGLPIVRCVEMVGEQARTPELRAMLKKVAEDVSGGYPLAQSFENNAPDLPVTFIETIRAGEASGTLEICFERLEKYFDKQAKIRGKVISTLTYPAIVIFVAIVVFIIVMVKAVPMFVTTFAEMGTDLPGITKGMIAVSNFMTKQWLTLVFVILALVLTYFLVRHSEKGRVMLDTFSLQKSPLKKLHSMNAMSQFSATMATMLSAGLPIIQSLEVTANVITNSLISNSIRRVCRSVEQGRGLAESMREEKMYPQLLVEMTNVGEQSGNLEKTLTVVSDYYNNEVTVLTDRLLSLLEPVITIGLAVMTVILLLGVYLPMFSMYGGM